MPEPSLVFVNGTVFTADPARPWARALAVAGGRIRELGSDREVLAATEGAFEVIDLAGRMLLPGFQDAHVHPVHGGLGTLRCDLLGCDGWEGAAAVVRAYAAAHPREPWVLGRGWAYEWFVRGTPDAALLDEVVPDRPAHLVVRDGHSSWANSLALTLAGIDDSTPDPPDGRIERLPDGTPQGTLHEGAMDLVEQVVPPTSPADLDAGLDAGQAHLLSLGITAWQDAWVPPEYHAAYLRAVGERRLLAQVRGALWWDREGGDDQVEALMAMREEATGPYVPGTVKLMLDGVCENLTASLLEPYTGGEGSGIDFIDPDDLARIVTRLDGVGFQCHFHAIGDAAVRSALDAVEAARLANGWNDLRHTIAHIQVVHPADVPRFHSLGVVANCQPLWACYDEAMTDLTVPVLGEQRSATQYPFASLLRSGASLAMGSDWPVTPADVPPQVSVAVRRLPPAGTGAPVFLPDERLRLGEALLAATAGSAHVNHLDASRGVLRVGNVADLTVLDRDPFLVDDPADVGVDLTVVGGTIVHDRGAVPT